MVQRTEEAHDEVEPRRWRLRPSTYGRLTLLAALALAVIIVTGALVRLTGSGLGCPDWPECNRSSFVDVSSTHGAIEQVNRLFTGVVAIGGDPGRARRPRPRAPEAGPDVVVARPRRRRDRPDRARRHHGPHRPAPRRRPVPLRPVGPDPHRCRRAPPPRLGGARSLPIDCPRTRPPPGPGGLGPGRAGHRHRHGRDRKRAPRWRREGPAVRVRGDVRGPRPQHHGPGDGRVPPVAGLSHPPRRRCG